MKFSLPSVRSLQELIQQLSTGLNRLSLENLDGELISVTIPAGVEISTRNPFKSIPNYYIIVKQSGNGLITMGPTPWTTNNLFFINNGAVSVTATIFVMR